jgi:enoyl-CoA hydratase/carnithine racemase
MEGERVDILTGKDRGILSITFNRPGKKNAITSAMYQAMADALTDGAQDAAVRAILIAGQPTMFTAGNDLDDFLHHPPLDADAPVVRFMRALSGAPKPVVAAVGGAAVGIGTTMLLHCDLVYAADDAKFSMPFTQLGLCPEFASSLLFPRLAGYQCAAEKLMLGEPFPAQEALRIGLVSGLVPASELLAFAQAQAAKLAALPVTALRVTKKLMKTEQQAAVSARMLEENNRFREMLRGPETKEAFAAFLEKRRPDFTKFS